MTVSEGCGSRPAGLVLVAVGAQPALKDRLAAAAETLAMLSGWPRQPLATDRPPCEALAALPQGRNTQAPPAWIAPLPVDPGLGLGADGSWAELLGAFRQPTALVLDAAQLACGWPAAATALLRQEGVPLVGLIQLGGEWDPERRRGDGLPWLGLLDGAEGDPAGHGHGVMAALAQRWRGLDLQ